jgi:hypothetical protein
MAEPTDSVERGTLAPPAPPKPVPDALTASLVALLVDAAFESWMAGSTARWWIAGVTVVYLAALAASRRRIDAGLAAAASSLVFLGLLTTSAWFPDGQFRGLVALRQSSSTLMSAATGLTVAMAVIALLRLALLPRSVKGTILALGVYAVGAWFTGAVSGTPYTDLLHGSSVWRQLPFWLQGAVIGGVLLLPIGLVAQFVTAVRCPAGPWRWQQTIASAVMLVMIGTSVTSTPGGGSVVAALTAPLSAPAGRPPDQAALNDQLERSLRAIEDGERESPRDRWDPAYVVEQVGKDPDKLFAWVRDSTFWIPYRGLLRGPVGVLMDRQGSSLDRAVLLATLLKQAGYPVRLVRDHLSAEQALRVLPALLSARAVNGRFQNRSVAMANVDDVSREYQLKDVNLTETLWATADQAESIALLGRERVTEQARRVLNAVRSETSSPPELREQAESAAALARDHWWVQRRAGDDWIDYDLAEIGGSSGAGRLPSATFALESLPDEERHRVTLKVVAEQWTADGLSEHTALEHTLRPAALTGTPVLLRLWPVRWPERMPGNGGDAAARLRTTALEQHEWLPVLQVGSEVVTRASIRDTGELNENPAPDAGANAGAKASGAVKSAESAFGGADDRQQPQSSSVSSLTAVWLEYIIDRPGERRRIIRRQVVDLLPAGARAVAPVALPELDEARRLTRSLALMRETEILPVSCRLAPEFVTHLAGASVLANRDVLRALVHADVADATVEQLAARTVPPPGPLQSLALARFAWSRFSGEIFIDRPNVLTRHLFAGLSGANITLWHATDIVANEIGVDVLAPDPYAIRVEQGVLDTNAESLLYSGAPTLGNAADAFASTMDWVKLASADDPQLALLPLADDVRSRILQDLKAGHIVLAPRRPIEGPAGTTAAWWRLDAVTGDTLGVGASGWGQTLVEFAFIVAFGAIWFGLLQLWLCKQGLHPSSSGESEGKGVCLPSRGGSLTQGKAGTTRECLGAIVGGILAGAVCALAEGSLFTQGHSSRPGSAQPGPRANAPGPRANAPGPRGNAPPAQPGPASPDGGNPPPNPMAQSGPPPVPNPPPSRPGAPPSAGPHARYNSAKARYDRAVQEVDRAIQEHGEKVQELFKDDDGVPYYEGRKNPFADPKAPQKIREADEARWRADRAFAEYDEAATELKTAQDALPPPLPAPGGSPPPAGGGPTPQVPGPQSGKTYPGIGQPGVGTTAQSGNTIQGVQPTPPIQVVPPGESKQGLNPFGATQGAPCPPYCGGPSGSGTQKQVLGVNGTRAVVQNSNRR